MANISFVLYSQQLFGQTLYSLNNSNGSLPIPGWNEIEQDLTGIWSEIDQ